MADESFAESLNLTSVGTVTFNRTGPTFNRSALMAAVRTTSSTQKGKIADEAGRTWEIVFAKDQNRLRLSLVGSTEAIIATHLGAASENTEDRLAVLDAETKRVNLPSESRDKWAVVMSERVLTETEVDAFVLDPMRRQLVFAPRSLAVCKTRIYRSTYWFQSPGLLRTPGRPRR